MKSILKFVGIYLIAFEVAFMVVTWVMMPWDIYRYALMISAGLAVLPILIIFKGVKINDSEED